MNRDEFNKIKQSLKDPNFHNILQDYMLEISDPKNKQEHDDYLLQLQKEGDLPKDMNLIKPDAFFCIETRIASDTDKKFTQRLYVNVCTSDQVEEAKSVTQQNGSNWSVPYMTGRLRYDQDDTIVDTKFGKVISVIDIVFHMNIIPYVMMSKDFKKMICDIAIDAVDNVLAQKKEKLDRDYKVLDDKCVGGTPSLMPVRTKNFDGSTLPVQIEKPKLYHDIMNEKDKREKENVIAKDQTLISELDSHIELEVKHGYPLTPKYKIVYSYELDSDAFIESKYKNTKKPNGLNIEIQLPKVENASVIKCDLDNNVLIFEYENIYYLTTNLPLIVDATNYKAKFEKKQRVLKLSFTALNTNTSNADNISTNKKNDVEENNANALCQYEEACKNDVINENKPFTDAKHLENNFDANKDFVEAQRMSAEPKDIRYHHSLVDETPENDNNDYNALNENITLELDEKELTKLTLPSNAEVSEIPIYNKQRIDNQIFILFNLSYTSESLLILYGSKTIVIINNNNYSCIRFDKDVIKIDVQMVKDFLTIILDSGNDIDGIETINFISLNDLTDFINDKNLVEYRIENDQHFVVDNIKAEDKDQIDEADCNDKSKNTYVKHKDELDYNFMMLHINKDAFSMI